MNDSCPIPEQVKSGNFVYQQRVLLATRSDQDTVLSSTSMYHNNHGDDIRKNPVRGVRYVLSNE